MKIVNNACAVKFADEVLLGHDSITRVSFLVAEAWTVHARSRTLCSPSDRHRCSLSETPCQAR